MERFVWIRILPIRMSLHTSHTACSMVSPALKMDTPQILSLADRFPWYITPCGVSTTCSCKNSSLLSTKCSVVKRGHLPTLQMTQILFAFFSNLVCLKHKMLHAEENTEPSLNFLKYHVFKYIWGSGGIEPCTLNPHIR